MDSARDGSTQILPVLLDAAQRQSPCCAVNRGSHELEKRTFPVLQERAKTCGQKQPSKKRCSYTCGQKPPSKSAAPIPVRKSHPQIALLLYLWAKATLKKRCSYSCGKKPPSNKCRSWCACAAAPRRGFDGRSLPRRKDTKHASDVQKLPRPSTVGGHSKTSIPVSLRAEELFLEGFTLMQKKARRLKYSLKLFLVACK